ncbi:MAG: hypothetical protein H7Z42_00215 [Roseiflexaceae bacterium]|nr:hypothetical protein [Roseiflexaceae bacterium]
MTTTTLPATRATLGNYMSLICFQYLRVGTEDVAERAPVVAAGRQRGYDVIAGLGLLGAVSDGAAIRQLLDDTLGERGTRLCLVQAIHNLPDGAYRVHLTEGACTFGQVAAQPHCAFTLGVFIGALHGLTGTRMRGQETECCACGAEECIYVISPV